MFQIQANWTSFRPADCPFRLCRHVNCAPFRRNPASICVQSLESSVYTTKQSARTELRRFAGRARDYSCKLAVCRWLESRCTGADLSNSCLGGDMHEQTTVAAEQPARGVRSGSSYIQPALVALAGALVLGLVLGVVAPHLAVNFQYNRLLIFAAGAAADRKS